MGKNAHDTIIHNALIVNEGRTFRGYVCIKGEFISEVNGGDMPDGDRKSTRLNSSHWS